MRKRTICLGVRERGAHRDFVAESCDGRMHVRLEEAAVPARGDGSRVGGGIGVVDEDARRVSLVVDDPELARVRAGCGNVFLRRADVGVTAWSTTGGETHPDRFSAWGLAGPGHDETCLEAAVTM